MMDPNDEHIDSGHQDGTLPSGAPDTAPDPQTALDLSKFDQRLKTITDQLSSYQQEQKAREERSQLERYQTQLANKHNRAKSEVEAAERQLAEAFDEGDGAKIAKAQRALTEQIAARERAANAEQHFRSQMRQAEERQGGSSGAPTAKGGQESAPAEDVDFTNLERWRNKHQSWYGVDKEMTKAAHAIDADIREAGVITVGSPEYFQQIDRIMAQKYPSKFNAAPQTGGSGSGASRQQAQSAAGRIPRDVVEGWKRMGIDTSDDATIARMVDNRRKLAEKGILPEHPAYGRVVS